MTLARSGVIDSVEITRSALSVCSIGMRVGPVVVTISSFTPRSLASSCAVSTSEPVGWSLSSVMPKGGIARSMAIRIFLACRMLSSVSAAAAEPNVSDARLLVTVAGGADVDDVIAALEGALDVAVSPAKPAKAGKPAPAAPPPLAAATPGLRELLTIGKIWELAQPRRRARGAQPYDVVVVDAPATGHGLALLEAPRSFANAAQVGPIARYA